MMNLLKYVFTVLICTIAATTFAQKGGVADNGTQFLPGAIYEVRYWTNMATMDSQVYIDTMYFFGNDRISFEYTNEKGVSIPFRKADSLAYTAQSQLSGNEKKIKIGDYYVRNMNMASAAFRGYDRYVYRLFVTDINNVNTGVGDYLILSREFGIIMRYNHKGEVYMLNRIDVVKDGQVKDEIDLLPLQLALQKTNLFRETKE